MNPRFAKFLTAYAAFRQNFHSSRLFRFPEPALGSQVSVPTLTHHQQRDKETQGEIARSYNVSAATISRLAP